jgi:hypothetical protein
VFTLSGHADYKLDSVGLSGLFARLLHAMRKARAAGNDQQVRQLLGQRPVSVGELDNVATWVLLAVLLSLAQFALTLTLRRIRPGQQLEAITT